MAAMAGSRYGIQVQPVRPGHPVEHPRYPVPVPNLQMSPIGVIPKHNCQEKWRLIVDLSSPEGQSIIAGLDKSQCSIRYSLVDEATQIIRQLAVGTLMAKLDRIVPVHP